MSETLSIYTIQPTSVTVGAVDEQIEMVSLYQTDTQDIMELYGHADT